MDRYRELTCLAFSCPTIFRALRGILQPCFMPPIISSHQWPQQHHEQQTLKQQQGQHSDQHHHKHQQQMTANKNGHVTVPFPDRCNRRQPPMIRRPDKECDGLIRDIAVATSAYRTDRKLPNCGPVQVHWHSGLFDETLALIHLNCFEQEN